jgi:hypothetical protein
MKKMVAGETLSGQLKRKRLNNLLNSPNTVERLRPSPSTKTAKKS